MREREYSNEYLVKFMEEQWKGNALDQYNQYYEIEYDSSRGDFFIFSLIYNKSDEILNRINVGDIVWDWKKREYLDATIETSKFKHVLDKIIDSNGNTYFIYEVMR